MEGYDSVVNKICSVKRGKEERWLLCIKLGDDITQLLLINSLSWIFFIYWFYINETKRTECLDYDVLYKIDGLHHRSVTCSRVVHSM